MHNSKYQCHMAPSCTYHLPIPSFPSCSTRGKLLKNIWEFSGEKKRQENGSLAEKWQNWKSKRTRQKNKKGNLSIGKGTEMTALRFQTGDISHLWPPFGRRTCPDILPKVQVAGYTVTLHMHEVTWHGAWCTQNALRWQLFHLAPAINNQNSAVKRVSTGLQWIFIMSHKNATVTRSESIATRAQCLLESGE